MPLRVKLSHWWVLQDDAPAPAPEPAAPVVYETVISVPEQQDNTQHVYVSGQSS